MPAVEFAPRHQRGRPPPAARRCIGLFRTHPPASDRNLPGDCDRAPSMLAPGERLGASHLHPPWISPSRPTAQGRASRRRPTRGGPPVVDNDARNAAAAGTGKKRPGSGAGRRPGAGRRGARPARPGTRRPSAVAGLPAPRPARRRPPPGRGRRPCAPRVFACAWTARSASRRGVILAAARHALDLHQWLVAPDFDQEGASATRRTGPRCRRRVRCHPAAGRRHRPARLARWRGHGGGGARTAARAALVRFWTHHRLLRCRAPDRSNGRRSMGVKGAGGSSGSTLSAGGVSRGRPRPRPGSGRYGGRTTSRSDARPLSPNSRRLDRCVTSTAIPAARKSSSKWVAFLTAMPRPAASDEAESKRRSGEDVHRGGGAGVQRPRSLDDADGPEDSERPRCTLGALSARDRAPSDE